MLKIMKIRLSLSKICQKYCRLFSGHGVYCVSLLSGHAA